MLHHIGVFATDFGSSRSFYTAVLRPLGIELGYETETTAEFWRVGSDTPSLSLESAVDVPTTGVHIAFAAQTAEQVDDFFECAKAFGAPLRHAPRQWPEYRAYCAFVSDPDGNNIEAVNKAV